MSDKENAEKLHAPVKTKEQIDMGHRIRDQRIALQRRYGGFRQVDVADKLGISREGYAHYELGNNDVSTSMLQRIAQVLETSVPYLLGLQMEYAPHVVEVVQRFSGEPASFWEQIGNTAEFYKQQQERLAMAAADDADEKLHGKITGKRAN